MKFNTLKVIEKNNPTDTSCYITFDIPKSLKKKYVYKAGQYVSVRIKDENNIHQSRCYSICGPIENNSISICSKKVPNGLLSNYLFESVNINDSLDVSFPEGDFTLSKSNKTTKAIVFLSAGSGITPIKSQIDLLLHKNHKEPIYLIYGNNSKKDVIFYDYFKEIEAKYPNFKLVLILRNTPLDWSGEQGVLIQNTLINLFNNYEIPLKNTNYYISGPLGMIENAVNFLKSNSISEKNIFKETFFTNVPEHKGLNKIFDVKIKTGGKEQTIKIKGSENILSAILNNGIEVDNSCKIGTCLKCICTLTSGEVVAQNDKELSKSQKNNNVILACQSYVSEENTTIDFDKKIKTNFIKDRSKLILAGLGVFILAAFFILKPETNTLLAKGNMNTGHEELDCVHCHKDAPGTARQQIQRNVKHFLGKDVSEVHFGKLPVENKACISCHDRPNDNHPVYRFNEPKFKDAREAIHPETCTSCHNEHHGERVTFKETNYCINCHKDIEIKDDPLDIKHKQLIDNEEWNTCLQCHDFHGNHIMEVVTKINDTIPIQKILDYMNGGEDPYSKEKTHIVNLDSIK